MTIFSKIRAKKNTSRLLNICSDLIDKYEAEKESNRVVPSCKGDLMALLKGRFSEAQEEIADWKDCDTDYIRIAHSMLAHGTFDLLASGRYHIHYGMLNPMSCAANLMAVYSCAMRRAVETGEITEDIRKEQLEYLHKCIAEVG